MKEKFSQQKKFSQGTKNSHEETKILTAKKKILQQKKTLKIKQKFTWRKKDSHRKTKILKAKEKFIR